MTTPARPPSPVHEVSLVVPVYQGEKTLGALADEIAPLVSPQATPEGRTFRVADLLLDEAVRTGAQLVYARPANEPPHGLLRNLGSAATKWLFVHVLGSRPLGAFNSFRLVEGEVARGVAAYCGADVYLDVALSWVVASARHCPVTLRAERGRRS